jgi:hypothetical protein
VGFQGQSYHPPANVELVWAATNELPSGLWIYKVIPQEFSGAVVSNLMTLGNFNWQDITKKADSFIPDKNLFRFLDKKDNPTRTLVVAPTFGWIEYNTDSKTSTNGVPSDTEVEKMALDVFFKMGLDSSLLCDKHFHQSIQGRLSHDGQKLTTNVVSRGITYSRQINGIESKNSACFTIDFGGNSQMTHFWLNWRNLLPYEAHPTLAQNQIIDSIKSGQAITFDWESSPNILDGVKKISVVKINPLYFEDGGMNPLDFMYPYAKLELVADLEGTNSVTFHLQCPILSTNSLR